MSQYSDYYNPNPLDASHFPQIPTEGSPARDLAPADLLREQHYLKLFLYQLENSSNLPTLSDPGLLVQILQENEAMEGQLELLRGGRREQVLQSQLLVLSREAEVMMNEMREFKGVRENEKAELKKLER